MPVGISLTEVTHAVNTSSFHIGDGVLIVFSLVKAAIFKQTPQPKQTGRHEHIQTNRSLANHDEQKPVSSHVANLQVQHHKITTICITMFSHRLNTESTIHEHLLKQPNH